MSNFLNDLDKWVLDAIEKSGAEEPTAHPSQSVDNGDQPATTDARAAENESDVKSEIIADSVDEATGEAAEGPGRGENNPITDIGTKAAPTGEDPSSETESVKPKPEDPGTAHPAKATMGEKYSAAQLRNMGDAILADIAVATAAVEKTAESCAAPKVKAATAETEDMKVEAKPETDEIKKAKEAGKEAAAMVADQLDLSAQVQNAQPNPTEVIMDIRKTAAYDAGNVSDYLAGFLAKAAEGEVIPQDTGEEVIEETSDAMPAGMPGAEAEMAAGMGGAPEAGGEDIDAIVEALVQAGVTPEELMALVEGQGGAEGLGAEGMGAEAVMPEAAPEALPPEAEAAMAEELPKMASWNAMPMERKKSALVAALTKAAEKMNQRPTA